MTNCRLATFVAFAVFIVLGSYWFFVLRLDQSEEAALRKRLRPEGLAKRSPKEFRLLKPVEQLSQMPRLDTVLGQMGRVHGTLAARHHPGGNEDDCRNGAVVGGVPRAPRLRRRAIAVSTPCLGIAARAVPVLRPVHRTSRARSSSA